MRKYIILFFSGMLLLFACGKRPEGIIKPDEMANLLTDIHLADGAMMNIPQIPDSVFKYGMGSYLKVFNKYHTDSAQFNKSFKYYTYHPDDLVGIYDEVLKKLQVKNDSVNALLVKINKEQMKKNSQSKPVAGRLAPPVANRSQPVTPALQAKPGVPPGGAALRTQMLEKLRLHRDSIKKHLKNSHAVPAQ